MNHTSTTDGATARAVAGWPVIASGLETLIETGEPLAGQGA